MAFIVFAREFSVRGRPEGSPPQDDLRRFPHPKQNQSLAGYDPRPLTEHGCTGELLLMRGADPDLRYEGAVTPLLCAVRSGNLDMVRLLLKQGANVGLKGHRGLSALLLAEACGFKDIADLIRDS